MTLETPFNATANTKPDEGPEPEGLWQAISWGQDIEQVRTLLDAEPEALRRPVRYSEHYLGGDQALHIACRYGHPDIVELLLSRGAGLEDLNKPEGASPLFAAAQASQFAVLDLLLKQGANIETRDRKDRTPLWYAASQGHERAVDYLLAQGADCEATGSGKLTPLVAALQEKKFGVALALVSHGANIAARDETGATALEIAGRDAPEVHRRMLEKEQEKIALAAAALRDDIDRAAHQGVDMSGKLKAPMQLTRRKPPGFNK